MLKIDANISDKIAHFSSSFSDSRAIYVFKDLSSNFLYANPFCVSFLGYSKSDSLLGHNDHDFLWCDYADLYKQEEREVLDGQSYISLVPSVDSKGDDILFFSSRELVYDNGARPIGILCQARPVVNKNTLELSNLLSGSKKTTETYTSGREINSQYNLTKCERECLFFLLRGNSSKMIASILCRTKKCIDFHVENLKHKFGVASKFELTTKAIHEGYLYEIPKSLLKNKNLVERLK